MITAEPWGCIWLFGGKNCCHGFFWPIPLLRIKTYHSFVFYASLLVRSFQVKIEQSMHTENKNLMFWNSSKKRSEASHLFCGVFFDVFSLLPYAHIDLRSWMDECVNGSLLLIPDGTWTVTYMLFKPPQSCVHVWMFHSQYHHSDFMTWSGWDHYIYIHFMIWKSCSLRVCVHHQGHT